MRQNLFKNGGHSSESRCNGKEAELTEEQIFNQGYPTDDDGIPEKM